MNKRQHNDGFRIHMGSAILYASVATFIGFIIRAESNQSAVDTRLGQLERRTDTLEYDLKAIKESLYEIRGDVKLLLKEQSK